MQNLRNNPTDVSKFRKGVVFLLISVVLYSIMPVLIRFLGSGFMPPASQVFLRYIVAFFCAVVYFRVTAQTFVLARRDFFVLGMVALFGYALTNLFYTYGVLLTQIGTVLFIFFSISVMMPILAQFFWENG